MSTTHNMGISLAGTITKRKEQEWPEEIEEDFYQKQTYRLSNLRIVSETETHHTAECDVWVNVTIVTDDEEYKPWKLVDWPESVDFDGQIKLYLNYDKFKLEDHDCWSEEDEE